MTERPVSDNMLSRLIAAFFLLSICLGTAGYLYYLNQKQHISKQIQDELSAIADLKTKQVEAWRKERLGDATSISQSGTFADLANRFFSDPGDPGPKKRILAFLRTFQNVYGYRSIVLADSRGVVRLGLPVTETDIGPGAQASLREAIDTRKAILTDVHKTAVVDYVHLDLLAPLFLGSGKKTAPVGALLFRVDADLFLGPLIQSWPGSSKTAETLLFRREESDVVILNETRHRKGTALAFRMPLSRRPALAAVLDGGGTGVIEVEDYRDVAVLAAVQQVPNTNWSLVAKVDREELDAPLRKEASRLLIVVFTLITATGVSIVFWWRQKSAEYLRKQYESELLHRTLSQKYFNLSRYANDIIMFIDSEGNINEANNRAVTAYGYTHDELLRMNIRDIRPPETHREIAAQMQRVREQNGLLFETVHRRKDGANFPVEVSSRYIDEDGKSYYQSIIRDITERKQAEASLIQEKNKSDAIIAAIGDGITIQDRDFRIIYQNQVHKDMVGDHVGEYCYQAYQHREARCDECPAARSFEDGNVHTEERTAQVNGETGYVEITSSPLRDETGNIVAGIEVVRNITSRKKDETTLKQRNEFIEAVLAKLPIGLAVHSMKDGRAVYLNPKFEEIYGWPRDLITSVGEFFERVYPDPSSRKEISEKILADIASGDPERMRWENIEITTMQGDKRRINAFNIPVYEQDLMISTVQDVTRSRLAEEALIRSENRYKHLVESVTDYIYTVEVESGRPVATYHGPGCVTVTGYTSDEYLTSPDLWIRMIHEEDRKVVFDRAERLLTGEVVPPFEHRIIHKDGSLRWVRNTTVPRYDAVGRLVAYDGLITDITKIRLLENQLRQAQKMEAVGQLAGGVAHDFNNILTAIIGYGNLLLMKMPPEEMGRTYVEHILSSSERAAHLTHSLLAFSRKQIIDLKPVNVNDIISRVQKLLGRVIGEDIEFRTVLHPGVLTVLADSVQIEQVLMNLATNARDAMPEGGSLLIETSPVELGEEFIRTYSYGKPGPYVLVSVTDTGTGIEETVRNRIFEPFFTTKEVGKGTGLGLAMVYGIIKQHNGYIHVSSEPGRGTTFKLYLPVIDSKTGREEDSPAATAPRGHETVLLAEDDSLVRDLARSVLEDFGYRVIEAADGEEAVRKFMENRDRVDLLVLDIIMPKKNGKEVYLEIKKVRPGIKALFTSGYTADIVHKKGILETGLDFIVKPSTPGVFLKKVREVLNKK